MQDKKVDGFKGEQLIVLPTEVFQEYIEHPLVKRLFLTDVGYFPQAAHHYRDRREGIEEYIFIYCMGGKGVITVDEKKYSLREREAFCIPGGHGHRYYSDEKEPWSILWVHFKGEDVMMYPLDECQVIYFHSDYATNRMRFLFELLFRVLEGNYTLGNFIYISQILSLILAETYYREKNNAAPEQNRYVTEVVKYMYKHISEKLTLDEIVKEFELSKSYLNIIFQKCTRHAPMDFYNQLKMKEACKMLRRSDARIYEVAWELGYRDQYYFSRMFKKAVGVSPKLYKNTDYIHDKD